MRLPLFLNAPRRRGNDKRRRQFRPTLLRLEDRMVLSPTIFTVTGIGDSPSDPSTPTSGDLRYCVGLANANTSNPAGSLIEFSPSVYNTPQTITLVGNGLTLGNAADQTTITGPGAALTVSGGGPSSNFSVFTVNSGATASISGLTIANGNTSDYGGGVSNGGNLTLSNDTLTANSAFDGGGILNQGTATLINVTLYGNSATYGGGIGNHTTVNLTDVTIFGNSAVDGGGGIAVGGTTTLNNTIVANNSGGDIGFASVSGSNNLIDDAATCRRVDQRR